MANLDDRAAARKLAAALTDALVDDDLDRLEALLHHEVIWGDCATPADVVALVASIRADGVEPLRIESDLGDDRIVVSIDVAVAGDVITTYHAVFVQDGKVVEVVPGQTKAEAMSVQRSTLAVGSGGSASMESVAPVLPVSDVAAAIAHYRGLGFDVESYDGGEVYAFARRGDVQLHLSRVDDLDPATTTTAIYLYVNDAPALFAEWRAADLDGRFGAPLETDYGLIEAFHIDPWGNLLRYGSSIG